MEKFKSKYVPRISVNKFQVHFNYNLSISFQKDNKDWLRHHDFEVANS